jgi:hypothetical protein
LALYNIQVPHLDQVVNQRRKKFIQSWITAVLLLPQILDFILPGSSAARYCRVLLFVIISASLIFNRGLFLNGKLHGFSIVLGVFLLYSIGSITAVLQGGSLTPNVGLLLLILLVLSLNFDLYNVVLNVIAYCSLTLIGLSAVAIIFRMNPYGLNFSSDGYPVFLNFIGVQGRNFGIFSHPNVLGQCAALSLLLLLLLRFKYYFFLLPIFCLVKCGSRTAIISIVVGLVVYITLSVVKSNRIKRVTQAETPIVLSVFFLGIFLASSFQFLSFIRFLDPDALTGRISIWQNSAAIFDDNLLFGSGWGWEARAVDAQLLNVWATSSHNAIFEILFSSGIIGLVVFLAMLAKAFANFTNLLPVEKVLLAAIITTGVSESYVDLVYPTIQSYIFFMIILGAKIDRRILL